MPFSVAYFAAVGNSGFVIPEPQRQNPARDTWTRLSNGAYTITASWNGSEPVQLEHYKTGTSGWDAVSQIGSGPAGVPRMGSAFQITAADGFIDLRVRPQGVTTIGANTVAKKRVVIVNFMPIPNFDGVQPI